MVADATAAIWYGVFFLSRGLVSSGLSCFSLDDLRPLDFLILLWDGDDASSWFTRLQRKQKIERLAS